MTNDLIALITGANRGLGLETARQLGQQGYRVLLSARNGEKAAAAAATLRSQDIDATAVPMNVEDQTSIEDAVREITHRYGRLDVLVNNAGVALDQRGTAATAVDPEVVLATFKVNTLGPLRVIKAFLPLLEKSPAARIVNVSSGMGQLSHMGQGSPAYRISKTALNAVTKVFANELGERGIKINAVCPGWVRTDMGGPQASRSVEEGARGIVWAATLAADGPTGGYFRDGQSLEW